MFEKVIEWAEAHAAEGADLEELKGLLPATAEEVLGNAEVKRAFDSAVSKAVNNHDERFRAEKLPGMIEEERARIRAELNPEETPEQKRIRELEEKLAARDRETETHARRAALRQKASELKVDAFGLAPDDVEVLAGLGDEAETALEALVGRLNERFNTTLDQRVKERFGRNGAPRNGDPNLDEVAKLRAAGETEAAERLQLQSIYKGAKTASG